VRSSKPFFEVSHLVGVVLAGGASSRMGVPKSDLLFGGKTLLCRAVDRMGVAFNRVIVIGAANCGGYEGETLPDMVSGLGPLGGIYSAVKQLDEDCAVVAADMPFFDPDALLHMAEMASSWDVVIPVVGEYFEPLHAIWKKSCLPAMEQRVMDLRNEMIQGRPRGLRLTSLFDELRVLSVLPSMLCINPQVAFLNINSPVDYYRALSMVTPG